MFSKHLWAQVFFIYTFLTHFRNRTKKIEKGWVTLYVKEKANVNDGQIIHERLVITGSRLNRHNVIL